MVSWGCVLLQGSDSLYVSPPNYTKITLTSTKSAFLPWSTPKNDTTALQAMATSSQWCAFMYFKFWDAKALLPQWLTEHVENSMVYNVNNVYNSRIDPLLYTYVGLQFWLVPQEIRILWSVVAQNSKTWNIWCSLIFSSTGADWCLYDYPLVIRHGWLEFPPTEWRPCLITGG